MQTFVAEPSQGPSLEEVVDSVRNCPTNSANTNTDPSAGPSFQSQPESDVEPDDVPAPTTDDGISTVARAHKIINSSQISLDPKLGVFTVLGTTEPRVVKLYPSVTCSCPARANCYHVMAARMAIGDGAKPVIRQVNMTRLRKNARKRPDKTCGRKRPRLGDVVVIGPEDIDEVTTAEVTALVSETQNGRNEQVPNAGEVLPQVPEGATDQDTDRNIPCNVCHAADPPARKIGRCKQVLWVGCELCPSWFHTVCIGQKVGKGRQPVSYVCDACK